MEVKDSGTDKISIKDANTLLFLSKGDTAEHKHLAFKAKSEAEVEAFYKAAMASGGTDNGKPGPRDYTPGYFAAFVLDPDGNNIEAAYRGH